jgi:DNA-directed RNA polymerase specialized sigma24 family protein
MAHVGAPDDPDEFGAWVAPSLGPIAHLAARLAPAADRDDIVQDVLARAWSKRHMYDPHRGTPSAWLPAITADLEGKARRRVRWHAALPDLPHLPGTVDDDIDLARAIARLSQRQRLAVECYYFTDLSVADTAVVMRCAEGTVKSTLADARAKLRTLLEAQDDPR